MARCPAGHESEASDYCDTCGLVIGGESSGAAAGGPGLGASGAGVFASSAAGATTTAAPAAGGAGGSPCPVCQADRNGRFCEECGYDFELAEAMPQVTMTPGVAPAESRPEPEPEAGPEPASESGQGLDLEAELARAEAEATRAASAAPDPSPTSAPETPEAAQSSETAETPEPSYAGSLTAALSASSSAEIAVVVDADRDYYDAQVERGDIVESEFPFPKYPHERRFTFADGPVRVGRASASRGLAPEIDLTGPPLDPAVSHLHAQLLRHDEGWVVVDLGSSNGTRLNDAEEPLEAETEIPVKPGDRIHLGVWTTITVQ